jgi:hypothetical protein
MYMWYQNLTLTCSQSPSQMLLHPQGLQHFTKTGGEDFSLYMLYCWLLQLLHIASWMQCNGHIMDPSWSGNWWSIPAWLYMVLLNIVPKRVDLFDFVHNLKDWVAVPQYSLVRASVLAPLKPQHWADICTPQVKPRLWIDIWRIQSYPVLAPKPAFQRCSYENLDLFQVGMYNPVD